MGTRRSVRAALVATVIAMTASACSPPPEPTPSAPPTVIASTPTTEEEAFAAAEATYRAYIDAVNAERRGEVGPDPLSFLTGDALARSIEVRTKLEETGLKIKGQTTLMTVTSVKASTKQAVLYICVDSSKTRVFDDGEVDVTPGDRDVVQSLLVEFELRGAMPLITQSRKARQRAERHRHSAARPDERVLNR